MRGTDVFSGGKPPVSLLAHAPDLDGWTSLNNCSYSSFYYYFYGVFKICGQLHSGHAGAEMEGCKQAKGRSGWAPDRSHPVDG